MRANVIADPRRFQLQFTHPAPIPPRFASANAMVPLNKQMCWHESSAVGRAASNDTRGTRRDLARLGKQKPQ